METLVNGAAHVEVKAPTYSLLLCDRDALRKFWWPVIHPGLLRIKAKDKHSGYWQSEHVRQRLEAGFAGQIICECFLILQSNSSTPVGFVVTQAFNDEFLGVPLYYHQWIIWCERAPFRKVMRYCEPQIEKRAREFGLRGISGITSRMAWLHVIKHFGYRMHQIIIRKDFA